MLRPPHAQIVTAGPGQTGLLGRPGIPQYAHFREPSRRACGWKHDLEGRYCAKKGEFQTLSGRLELRRWLPLRRQLRTTWTSSSDLMGLLRYSVAPAFMASR